MLRSVFQKQTPPLSALRSLFETLYSNGFEAYLIGGAVRRALLGLPLTDFDITTNATPNNILALFDPVDETGKSFGSLRVTHADITVDITTYRTENQYKNSRHPSKVFFSESIQDDLNRRDFTINAIAYNPLNDTLVDTTGGMADFKHNCLRCIGDPHVRLAEDTLRLLRLARFASETGFTIHPQTYAAFLALGPHCVLPSKRRLAKEFSALMRLPKPSIGIALLLESDLLLRLFDSLNKGV